MQRLRKKPETRQYETLSRTFSDFKSAQDVNDTWLTAIEKWLIEFGGAFAIVFIVGMAIVHDLSIPMIAATFGAVTSVLYMVYDEQHFNPFLTLQAWMFDIVNGQTKGTYNVVISLIHVLWIWSLQLVGSILGAVALSWAFNDKQSVGATIPVDGLAGDRVIFYEFVASFFFGMIIFSLSLQNHINPNEAIHGIQFILIQKLIMPIAAGLVIFIATATIFPYTGASINFIRSIGPAIISKNTHYLGYVFLGQLIGYVSAGSILNITYLFRTWTNQKRLTA